MEKNRRKHFHRNNSRNVPCHYFFHSQICETDCGAPNSFSSVAKCHSCAILQHAHTLGYFSTRFNFQFICMEDWTKTEKDMQREREESSPFINVEEKETKKRRKTPLAVVTFISETSNELIMIWGGLCYMRSLWELCVPTKVPLII